MSDPDSPAAAPSSAEEAGGSLASDPLVLETNRPLMMVGLLVVAALSIVGFFTGTEPRAPRKSPVPTTSAPPARADDKLPLARSYKELRKTPRGEGSGWEAGAQKARTLSNGEPLTQETLERALARRARRRAYDGAPPTVPHPIAQDSAPECLACHGEGLRLGSARAGDLPHAELTNCAQCHVEQDSSVPEGELAGDPRDTASGFQGSLPVSKGQRAWPGAPPEIPHATGMRGNCLACHGPGTSSPMRSSHPERSQCLQCHAPTGERSASLGQRPPALGETSK